MKTLITFCCSLLITLSMSGQAFLFEDFSGAFPPAGWTIEGNATNWSESNTREAYGAWPECRLHYNPIFTNTTRLISPVINLTGTSTAKITFLASLANKGSEHTIGVATRSNGGPWHSVWQFQVTDYYNMEPSFIDITVNNEDTGKPGFQCCLFLTPSTSSYTFFDWYIDNFHLFSVPVHEIMMSSPGYLQQVNPPYHFTPLTKIRNIGQYTENFPAYLRIKDATGNIIHTDSLMVSNMSANTTKTLQFADYTFPSANQYYMLHIYTALQTDGDRHDDTIMQIVTTYNHSKQAVMMELSTSTGCGYCPAAEAAIDSMVEVGYKVGVVSYHTAYEDPFENEYSIGRTNDYGFWGMPTLYADGTYCLVGVFPGEPMFGYYSAFYNNLKNITTPFGIMFNGAHSGSHYTVNLTVDQYGPVLNQNLTLQCVLTENGLTEYAGGEVYNYVERLMIPDENGTVLDISAGNHQQIDLQFDCNPSWDTGKLFLNTFVQDTNTREILNGAMIPLSGLWPLSTEDIHNTGKEIVGYCYPNPTTTGTSLQLNMVNSSEVSVIIYNQQGIPVRSMLRGQLLQGTTTLTWNGTDDEGLLLPESIYLWRIITSDASYIRKVILLK